MFNGALSRQRMGVLEMKKAGREEVQSEEVPVASRERFHKLEKHRNGKDERKVHPRRGVRQLKVE